MPSIIPLLFLLLHTPAVFTAAPPPLQHGYYSKTCPNAEAIVRSVLKRAMEIETRHAASILRLMFHDCFVNGCDGSFLLDDTADKLGEKAALANVGSLRSYGIVDEIKAALEQACPGIVSCADLIVIAARDAVVLSGGPNWEVMLGRLDSLTASQQDSSDIMPSAQSGSVKLINLFKRFNLTIEDLVSLSGAHTIGIARCFTIYNRLYNHLSSGMPDPAIDPCFHEKLDDLCPIEGDEEAVGDLDRTPKNFDNQYFKDLVEMKGFLNSDQTLFTNPETRKFVEIYSRNQSAFFEAFVKGMHRLGDIPSAGPGEIRRDCRSVNC